MDPHLQGQSIFGKGVKALQWVKGHSFNKICWKNWKSTQKNTNIDCPPYHTQINLRWITDINVKGKQIILLEESLEEYLYSFG